MQAPTGENSVGDSLRSLIHKFVLNKIAVRWPAKAVVSDGTLLET